MPDAGTPPHRALQPLLLLGAAGALLAGAAAPPALLPPTAQAAPTPSVPGIPGGHHRVATEPGALGEGLHQTAYSRAQEALYATTAGPRTSRVHRLDAQTLTVQASAAPPASPADPETPLAAYGVGVDDQHGTVWLTHSRHGTVSVIDQETLRPLATHPVGTVPGARDVVHDPASGRVFVSSASPSTEGTGSVSVFEGGDEDGDGVRYEKIGDAGVLPRAAFSPMSLALDPLTGTVWTTSLSTPRAMAIDTDTLRHRVVDLDLPDTGDAGPSGIAVDPLARRLYIASQDDDLLLVTDFAGRRIAATPTGDGALSVAFDPVRRRAYVTNFARNTTPDTTVSVLSARGRLLHQLAVRHAHHVRTDGRGSAYVSTLGGDNQVLRLTPCPTP